LPSPRDGVIAGHAGLACPIIRGGIRPSALAENRAAFHPRSGFRFIRTTIPRIEPASRNIHLILLMLKRK